MSTQSPNIDSLLSGKKWENLEKNSQGQPIIYWSFYEDDVFKEEYYGTETGVKEVSEEVKSNVRAIMKQLETIINVDFDERTEINKNTYGQIRFMISDGPEKKDVGGYANYPPSKDDDSESKNYKLAGDVHLSPKETFSGSPGSGGYQLLIHEILHALGLKHPNKYSSDDPEKPVLPFDEDNNTNTVMSYNRVGSNAATPMPYDIKALQTLYDPTNYNADDTTYSFTNVNQYTANSQSVGSSGAMKLAIWDSGGTADTLNFLGLSPSNRSDIFHYVLDLREGGIIRTMAASSQSSYKAEGDSSKTEYSTTTHGTVIAFGTVIENATGSLWNDVIFGNDADNKIDGNAGNDFIFGLDGKNDLLGGFGNDTLYGGGQDDILSGSYNDDRLLGFSGDDFLNGGNGNDILYGYEGNDVYVVDSSGDYIEEYADGGLDMVRSSISFTLSSQVENLNLTGDNAIDGTGNELDNYIEGNKANNKLKGLDGSDFLRGRRGNDTLDGGKGDDLLRGGDNADLFRFKTDSLFNTADLGVDRIVDFTPSSDKIALSKVTFKAIGNNFTNNEFEIVNNDDIADNSQAFIIYNSGNGTLFYNPDRAMDGFGTGAQFAVLANYEFINSLSVADFTLV